MMTALIEMAAKFAVEAAKFAVETVVFMVRLLFAIGCASVVVALAEWFAPEWKTLPIREFAQRAVEMPVSSLLGVAVLVGIMWPTNEARE